MLSTNQLAEKAWENLVDGRSRPWCGVTCRQLEIVRDEIVEEDRPYYSFPFAAKNGIESRIKGRESKAKLKMTTKMRP
jgi:hypothetical protein